MKISLYSIIVAIVLSSLLLTIVCLIRRKFSFSKLSDMNVFVFLYILGLIRLILPIDFTFTTGIPIAGRFAAIWDYLFYKEFSMFSVPFTIGKLVVVVIGIISSARLINFIVVYVKEMNLWNKYGFFESIQIERVMNGVRAKIKSIPEYTVIKCPSLAMPSVTGVIRRKILLPDMEYSDSELSYILLHELTHIKRNDMLKKLVVELFRCIFWWIPFSSFITKDIEQVMEIGCDSDVIKELSKDEKIMYMETLIDSLRRASAMKMETKNTLSFALQENHNSMIERFQLMTSSNNERNNMVAVVVLSGVVLFGISYIAAPIPYLEPAENAAGQDAYFITSDNTYLIYENGKYFLVTNVNESAEVPEEHAKNMIAAGVVVKEVYDEN